MYKILITGLRIALAVIFSLVFWNGDLFSQKTTFGDLIPNKYLPSTISPSDLLDCHIYFKIADSVNHILFDRTGTNPIPGYHCGNDTLSYNTNSIENYVSDMSPGAILARMIIDRNGSPVCCKVYMKGADKPDRQIADALSKLIMMPSYRNGQPIPTECRFLYDFLAPKTSGRTIID